MRHRSSEQLEFVKEKLSILKTRKKPVIDSPQKERSDSEGRWYMCVLGRGGEVVGG